MNIHTLKKTFLAPLTVFMLLAASGLTSCHERISSDPGLRLAFSVDTVRFDTVFSTIKSPTKQLMVYNPNRQAMRIDRITLAGGSESCFQVNVDGEAGTSFQGVEISGGDSVYVFVTVRTEELDSNDPLILEDRLSFERDGATSQQVILETFSQDAEILRGHTIVNDTTLTADKPYIIYDSLAIAPGKRLTLAPGCRLYFHHNANLFVYGNLHAVGTPELPVTLRGDRFDAMNFIPPIPYNEVAGQWGGLYLFGAGRHTMEHVHIRSGYVGVFLSYNGRAAIPQPEEMPDLHMVNCRLHNFLIYGLVAQNANLTVANSIISNTGSYTVYMNGGTHRFVHTTVANYFGSGPGAAQSASRDHTKPAVMIMNLNKTASMHTEFVNCVIAGNIANEFSLAARVPDRYDGTFRHTYIKRSPIDLPQFAEADSIRWHAEHDTLFRSTVLDYDRALNYNFEPDSVSPLRTLADPVLTREYDALYNMGGILQYDLNGIDRYAGDSIAAGAMEWRPTPL